MSNQHTLYPLLWPRPEAAHLQKLPSVAASDASGTRPASRSAWRGIAARIGATGPRARNEPWTNSKCAELDETILVGMLHKLILDHTLLI